MKHRSWLIVSILVIALMLITACQPKAAATSAPAAEKPKFKVALITPNPLGDRSFIDSAARGMERARTELGVQADVIETKGVNEHEAAMRGAIQKGYDLVLGLALDPQLMLDLAAEFPNQKFGAPGGLLTDKPLPANLASNQVEVHEGSFLVGVIAGMMTDSKVVGAVVGGQSPDMDQFTFGYKQGVLAVCPDCKVLVSYLGFDFSNPTLGLETALAQYDQNADIVYQVAGRSGEGVISASAERDKYSIGVDSNQDFIQPGHVIVSMIKRTDTAVFQIIKNAVDGTFKGGFFLMGLADEAAGLSWDEGSTTFAEKGPKEMVDKLPAVKAKVDDYRKQILAGTLKVCNTLKEDPAICDPLK